MPIKLRTVLRTYGISQADWGSAIKQHNGKQLSRAAGTDILSYNRWPKRTDKTNIKKQTVDFLISKGVSATEIETLWDEEPDALNRSSCYPSTKKITRQGGSPARETDQLIDLPEFEMLTQNAMEMFKLPKNPFVKDVQGVRDIFMSRSAKSVYAALEFEALNEGLLAIVGESGCGKTTLFKKFYESHKNNKEIVFVRTRLKDATDVSEASLYISIIKALGGESHKIPNAKEARAILVEKLILARQSNGGTVCMVIEEAHLLTAKLLTVLKSFWEIEHDFQKALSIILIGQPPLRNKLDERKNPDAISFIRRCGVKYYLPMDTDLENYLAFKFQRVGVELSTIFDNCAIDGLRDRLTKPRVTDNYLYSLIIQGTVINALNEAAENGFDKVTGDIMRAV